MIIAAQAIAVRASTDITFGMVIKHSYKYTFYWYKNMLNSSEHLLLKAGSFFLSTTAHIMTPQVGFYEAVTTLQNTTN